MDRTITKRRRAARDAAALIGLLSATAAPAQTREPGWVDQFPTPKSQVARQCGIAELLASDGGPNEGFGNGVSISTDGNLLVAGVGYHDHRDGSDAGAAYVFVRGESGWIEQGELVPGDDAPFQYFGRVAISGDGSTFAVGAPSDDDAAPHSGSVYVFIRKGDTLIEEAELHPADATVGMQFGFAVALSTDGNRVLIGSRFDDEDDRPPSSGAAYVFVRRGGDWVQEGKLVDPEWMDGEHGYSVALSGDGTTAVVGAPYDSSVGPTAGSVAVFELDNGAWHQTAVLTIMDPHEQDYLGFSVDISSDGEVIAAGVPFLGLDNAGGVAVFVRADDRWRLADTLVAHDGPTLQLGHSVDVSANGDWILAGAPAVDLPPVPPSGALIFRRKAELDWRQEARLFGLPTFGGMGSFVAISGDGQTAAVAGEADEPGNYAVFVVDRGCQSDIDGDGVVGIGDLLALLAAWGPCPDPSVCPADQDGDGAVGLIDVLLVLSEWNLS